MKIIENDPMHIRVRSIHKGENFKISTRSDQLPCISSSSNHKIKTIQHYCKNWSGSYIPSRIAQVPLAEHFYQVHWIIPLLQQSMNEKTDPLHCFLQEEDTWITTRQHDIILTTEVELNILRQPFFFRSRGNSLYQGRFQFWDRMQTL